METLYSRAQIIQYEEGDVSLEPLLSPLNAIANPKLYTVVEDELLTDIARREYRDPRMWYVIAFMNRLIDPFVEAGTNLLIPVI